MKFDLALVVDDDSITNFLSKRLVQKLSLTEHINVFTDAEKALEAMLLLATKKPTQKVLLLLDLNMPGMNGFEFLEKLSQLKLGMDLRVLVCTTSSNPKDINACSLFKICGLINKPITEKKIQQIMPLLSVSFFG